MLKDQEKLFFPSNPFDLKPSRGDVKRMEITLAALDCLATIGFDKTTYEAIAQKLGTRRAHINYYFKGKHEIIMACVKYIMANYQRVSNEHLLKAKSKDEMLIHYVEGPYLWAEHYPKELIVMMLFYYLCSIDDRYRELHDRIRDTGALRIHHILTNLLGFTDDKAKKLSKIIQNSISGFMLDGITTSGNKLRKMDNIDFVKALIDCSH